MRKMKDSGIAWIGKIPEEWNLIKIAYGIGFTGSGTTPPSDQPQWYQGNIPWITTSELREYILYTTNKCVSELALNTFSALKLYPQGSLIIAMYGATIGRMGFLGIEGTTNQACCVLYGESQLTLKYIFYFILSLKEMILNMGQGSGQPNLTQETIRALRVPAPNISEQKRITTYLDVKCGEIDRSMELVRQGMDKLKEYKKSVITEAVTKGLDPDAPMKDSGVTWIGEIPAGWEVYDLKNLVNLITDGTHKTPIYQNSGVPFLSIKDISSGKLDFSDTKFISEEEHSILKQRAHIEKGDLLFTRIGTLGVAVEINEEKEFSIFVSLGLLKINKNKILPKYLCFIMNSNYYFEYIQTVKAGGDTAAAKFNLKDVAVSPITYPPLEEQKQIVAFLDTKCAEIDALLAKKQALLDKLSEYKKSLIFECVTGKREVAA